MMCPYFTRRKQAYNQLWALMSKTPARRSFSFYSEESSRLLEHEEPDSESACIHDQHSHSLSVGFKEAPLLSLGLFLCFNTQSSKLYKSRIYPSFHVHLSRPLRRYSGRALCWSDVFMDPRATSSLLSENIPCATFNPRHHPSLHPPPLYLSCPPAWRCAAAGLISDSPQGLMLQRGASIIQLTWTIEARRAAQLPCSRQIRQRTKLFMMEEWKDAEARS